MREQKRLRHLQHLKAEVKRKKKVTRQRQGIIDTLLDVVKTTPSLTAQTETHGGHTTVTITSPAVKWCCDRPAEPLKTLKFSTDGTQTDASDFHLSAIPSDHMASESEALKCLEAMALPAVRCSGCDDATAQRYAVRAAAGCPNVLICRDMLAITNFA